MKTGYSLDGNATLDAASASDRISVTEYELITLEGAQWQETRRRFYTDATGTQATASTTRERLSADSATGLISENRTLSGDNTEQRVKTTVNATARTRTTTTTTRVGISQTALTTHKNGVLFSSTSHSVTTPVYYYYDAYGRSTGQSDPQTGRTALTEYNAQGQVARTTDLAGNNTFTSLPPVASERES